MSFSAEQNKRGGLRRLSFGASPSTKSDLSHQKLAITSTSISTFSVPKETHPTHVYSLKKCKKIDA
jgi:SET domain-containing protein